MKPAPLLPMSPIRIKEETALEAKTTEVKTTEVKTTEVKSVLPPLKSSLPPLKPTEPKTGLPPLKSTEAKTVETKSVLPPVKSSLPPLKTSVKTFTEPKTPEAKTVETKSVLPPLKSSLPPVKTPEPKTPVKTSILPSLKSDLPKNISPLAADIKENKKEIIDEITADVQVIVQKQKSALPPLVVGGENVGGENVTSLKPLSGLPSLKTTTSKTSLPKLASPKTSLPKLATSPKDTPKQLPTDFPTLKIAKEGVKIALNSEPSAAFQIRETSPVINLSQVGEELETSLSTGLATIASPANLPSNKKRSKTPKIKIPNIGSSAVKPSPKKDKKSVLAPSSGIVLPEDSTIILPIPITSPSAVNIPKTTKTGVESETMDKIKNVDLTRLKSDRVAKGKEDSGYSVQELKSIAGSLNLTKSGNKKELVERIKAAILKVNPNAFD